jgi:hypothetical protein
VVRIRDYQYPDGVDHHISEGGLVPNGMQMKNAGGTDLATFKQWKWETFYQQDLRAWIGKPLPVYVRADADATATVAMQAGA